MWGGADYEQIAERFAPVHDELVARLVPRAGEGWLDLATGTGGVALRAARAGADVTGLDLAPALLDQARANAAAAGLDVSWTLGDVQRLPYSDASFDVVVSSFGVIFAPDAEAAAGEMARVCRPGGRVGLACWEPGQGLHSYTRFAEKHREDPTARWGERPGAEKLLGEVFDLEIEEQVWRFEAESPEAAWTVLSTGTPPVKALVASLEPARAAELRAALIDHWQDFRTENGVSEPRRYLLILGRRR